MSIHMGLSPDLPPAPQLANSTMDEIFSRVSARPTGNSRPRAKPPTRSVETRSRLAALGATMLEAAYAMVLFNLRPRLTGAELEAEIRTGLPDLVERSVAGYRWTCSGRYSRGVCIDDTAEKRELMHAYVGAVFHQGGFDAVVHWIGGLVRALASPRFPSLQFPV